MLEFPDNKDPLTEKIIGCAIEVRRVLGAGLLEASYEAALAIEFQTAKIAFQRQLVILVSYKGRSANTALISWLKMRLSWN